MNVRGRCETARWRGGSFGSDTRNAMETLVEPLGELGVTMIAGSGDFSWAKGKVGLQDGRRAWCQTAADGYEQVGCKYLP